MFLFLGGLHKRIDNISQNMQRPIDVRCLSQPLPLHHCVLDPLASRKVNYVQFGLFHLDDVIFFAEGLDENGEYDMRAWTLLVHVGHGYSSGFISFQEKVDCLPVRLYFGFNCSFDKNAFAVVLSDLMDSFVLR